MSDESANGTNGTEGHGRRRLEAVRPALSRPGPRKASRRGQPRVARDRESPLCRHEELTFSAGGWYVRCPQCEQVWAAVRPGKSGQEPGLRAGAASDLNEGDVRRAR